MALAIPFIALWYLLVLLAKVYIGGILIVYILIVEVTAKTFNVDEPKHLDTLSNWVCK